MTKLTSIKKFHLLHSQGAPFTWKRFCYFEDRLSLLFVAEATLIFYGRTGNIAVMLVGKEILLSKQ